MAMSAEQLISLCESFRFIMFCFIKYQDYQQEEVNFSTYKQFLLHCITFVMKFAESDYLREWWEHFGLDISYLFVKMIICATIQL